MLVSSYTLSAILKKKRVNKIDSGKVRRGKVEKWNKIHLFFIKWFVNNIRKNAVKSQKIFYKNEEMIIMII